MSFSNIVHGNSGDHRRITSDQRRQFGTPMVFDDGREFVYSQAGSIALTGARLMQESVVITGHDVDLDVVANPDGTFPAIGATSVKVKNSTNAITKNQYADGFLWINSNTGGGQMAQIKSHPKETTGTGEIAFELYQHDALVVALDTNSNVGLRLHPYAAVIIHPQAAVTGRPVGVTPRAVTEDYFFWLQVKGDAIVLTNGVVIRGKTVVPSETTDGAIDVTPTNTNDTEGQAPVVGWVRTVGASGEYSQIHLTLGGL